MRDNELRNRLIMCYPPADVVLIIASKDMTSHFALLNEVPTRLTNAGLKIKLSKYSGTS